MHSQGNHLHLSQYSHHTGSVIQVFLDSRPFVQQKFDITAVLNEGNYNWLLWLLQCPDGHMIKIWTLAASIHLQSQVSFNSPTPTYPTSMPFWPLHSAAHHPNWTSISSCSHCWLSMPGLVFHESVPGYTRLSSPSCIWLFSHKIWGKWPCVASSCFMKDQTMHTAAAAGTKRNSWGSGAQDSDDDSGWAGATLALHHTARLASALCCKRFHTAKGFLQCCSLGATCSAIRSPRCSMESSIRAM